jgi:hypothetical protein
MSSRQNDPDEDAVTGEVTALVPQADFDGNSLAERQQAILEQLHRGLRAMGAANPELNAVWLRLRGEDWSWLVLVPGEAGYSTVDLARSLSQTGTRLSTHPVEFVDGTGVDVEGSSRLIARLGMASSPAGGWSAQGASQFRSSSFGPPITRTLVALESPLVDPLALSIALAADGVVLCVRRGRDRLASVRNTIQAVGPQRILCCMLID